MPEAPLHTTPYNEKELQHFKERLREEQEEAHEKAETLQERLERMEVNQQDELSNTTHHQADVGTEEDEREKFLIMMEKQKDKLDEIKAAFTRIKNGTYGICEKTGEKIAKKRLDMLPYTRNSVSAKRKEEKTGDASS